MPNAELHDQIEDLEAQIESFAEVAKSCKKWILLSKIGAIAGGVLLLANIVGFIFLDLRMTVLAIAAVLGGIALGGSNSSTLRRTLAVLRDAESLRARIINEAELPRVGDASKPEQSP
jgi:hypothetical protein